MAGNYVLSWVDILLKNSYNESIGRVIMRLFIQKYCFILCFISHVIGSNNSIIIPGLEAEYADMYKVVAQCQPVYEKFGIKEMFADNPDLSYTIPNGVLSSSQFAGYKDSLHISTYEYICLLSENHWIALNKRDIGLAKNIAVEIATAMHGKYGLYVFTSPDKQLLETITSNKFRWMEQAELSIGEQALGKSDTKTRISAENDKELVMYYNLAKYITNTPLFFQTVSYDDIDKVYDARYTSLLQTYKTRLTKINEFCEHILNYISGQNSEALSFLKYLFDIKERSYRQYMQYVFDFLTTTQMNTYTCVDKGQTSGGHRNTCLFNSSFSLDVSKNNIPSTKQGSLDIASAYVKKLQSIWGVVPQYKSYASYLLINDMIPIINRTKSNSGAEAVYSFEGEVFSLKGTNKDVIFPGALSNCSILEMSQFALRSNYCIISKQKTRSNYGNTLAGYYSCGFFGSDLFSIIPISCSMTHAQSLKRNIPKPPPQPKPVQVANKSVTTQPASKPATAQVVNKPGTTQPGNKHAAVQVGNKTGTTQPASKPATVQVANKPVTTQPASKPVTVQVASKPGTTQPANKPGTRQLASRPRIVHMGNKSGKV